MSFTVSSVCNSFTQSNGSQTSNAWALGHMDRWVTTLSRPKRDLETKHSCSWSTGVHKQIWIEVFYQIKGKSCFGLLVISRSSGNCCNWLVIHCLSLPRYYSSESACSTRSAHSLSPTLMSLMFFTLFFYNRVEPTHCGDQIV